MYLLDTNVISELRKPHRSSNVLRWVSSVPDEQSLRSRGRAGCESARRRGLLSRRTSTGGTDGRSRCAQSNGARRDRHWIRTRQLSHMARPSPRESLAPFANDASASARRRSTLAEITYPDGRRGRPRAARGSPTAETLDDLRRPPAIGSRSCRATELDSTASGSMISGDLFPMA
jgi:hypothetical protein